MGSGRLIILRNTTAIGEKYVHPLFNLTQPDFSDQIARLYRPVALDPDDLVSSSDDEDDTQGTMLLPTHHTRSGDTDAGKSSNKEGRIRLGDVWDEREELFGIGGSDDEDDFLDHPRRSTGTPSPAQTAGPKIVVTSS